MLKRLPPCWGCRSPYALRWIDVALSFFILLLRAFVGGDLPGKVGCFFEGFVALVELDNRPCARERDDGFDDDCTFDDSASAVLVELDATFLAEAE